MGADAQALAATLAAGAEAAQVRFTETDKRELNVEWDEPSLLRSTFDRQLEIAALVDGRKAQIKVNEVGDGAIERAAAEVVALARASRPDPANAVADAQPAAAFSSGPQEPDLDGMHERLEEFLEFRRREHPTVSLRGVHYDFTRTVARVTNTNGVDLTASTGSYTFVATFSGRQGADVSSFNYSVHRSRDLGRPIAEVGSFDRLMREAAGQLRPRKVGEKFVGDVVVTPDALGSFLGPVTSWLRDDALIDGTSVFADRLGDRIADPRLSLHAAPLSDDVAEPSFVTRDGFVAGNHPVIEDGVLRSFLLTQYGARKTGRARAQSDGDDWIVAGGDTPLDELLAGVERGVLLCRFSGGRPSDAGDFSGIAKNSWYVEDGKVAHALGETMVSGNLVRLVQDVRAVSRERVDFGDAVHPWIRFGGAVVS